MARSFRDNDLSNVPYRPAAIPRHLRRLHIRFRSRFKGLFVSSNNRAFRYRN